MNESRFSYKGNEVVVQDDHPNAVVQVGKRKFKMTHHHAEGVLAMWMCDEAYFASPDLMELARHVVDYGYLFDAPGRVVVEGGHGHDDHGPQRGARSRGRRAKGGR